MVPKVSLVSNLTPGYFSDSRTTKLPRRHAWIWASQCSEERQAGLQNTAAYLRWSVGVLVVLLRRRLIVGVRLLPVRSRGLRPASRSLTGNYLIYY